MRGSAGARGAAGLDEAPPQAEPKLQSVIRLTGGAGSTVYAHASPSLPIVHQLAATASRSFPVVASYAIGFVEPIGPSVHSPGSGGCEGNGAD